jgi:uncharacterized membrane protein YtjA (UPF0391 family)
MIRAALIFFVLAFVSSVMGVSNAGGLTTEIGHFFLLVFLALAIVSFCFGMMPTEDSETERTHHQRRDYDKSIL